MGRLRSVESDRRPISSNVGPNSSSSSSSSLVRMSKLSQECKLRARKTLNGRQARARIPGISGKIKDLRTRGLKGRVKDLERPEKRETKAKGKEKTRVKNHCAGSVDFLDQHTKEALSVEELWPSLTARKEVPSKQEQWIRQQPQTQPPA